MPPKAINHKPVTWTLQKLCVFFFIYLVLPKCMQSTKKTYNLFFPIWKNIHCSSFKCNFPASEKNSNKYKKTQQFPTKRIGGSNKHKPPPKKKREKKKLNVKRHRQLQYNIILIGNMFILETYCRLHHSQLIHIQK